MKSGTSITAKAEVVTGTLRMMGDRILLRPLKWEPSKILEVVRYGRPVRGEVMAVGPGHNPIKYKDGPKGKRSLMDYSKRFRPTEIKVGDIVELGGLNIFDGEAYSFPEVVVNSETLLVITERDVAGVVTEPTKDFNGLDQQPKALA